MSKRLRNSVLVIWVAIVLPACAQTTGHVNHDVNADLRLAIDAPHRQASSTRDVYRHPAATLAFFDVQPQHSVVEIWPGGKGWYTEILAPYLKDRGRFYAAHFNADSSSSFYRRSRARFEANLAASPALYSEVIVTDFNPPKHPAIAPLASVDRVLTFRNVHNWYMRGGGDARVLAAFQAFYAALKPGGILGVVEHRLPAAYSADLMRSSGYMHQDYVVRMAEQAGFQLLATSEINANSKDSAHHPEGVWSLPPSLRLGEKNRDHYQTIGESDRMTLKFIKPKQAAR